MITISLTQKEFDELMEILQNNFDEAVEWDCPDEAQIARDLMDTIGNSPVIK